MPFEGAVRRLDLPELMDGPCSEQDLRDCLRDLEEVNEFVLVHRPTLRWLAEVVHARQGSLHILDVGCGGGDMLRAIEKWAARRAVPVQLTGVDMNERSLRFAHERTSVSSCIRYVCGNAAAHPQVRNVDCIISSHLTHHLRDEEIVSFLQWMDQTARVGWFINDLHRERVPYLAFRTLARCMGWHPFIQHDGPVSVLRSFAPQEWTRYLASAGIEGATIHKVLPGRLCVEWSKRSE